MSTLQENQSLNIEYERNKKEREMKEEIERLNKRILALEEQLKEAKNCLGIISPSRELKEGKYWEKEDNKKIERLNNIINKAINYTTKQIKKYEGYDRDFEIVLSNIVVMLGSDKE